MKLDHVAIIGGGFSGAMLAINLLRHGGPRATLIERRAETARGVAYSTVHPEHLLNVRATNMSALPDEPDHFVRWLAARGDGRLGFVPRRLYGEYLDELLADALRQSGDRLRVIRSEAVDVRLYGGGAAVVLSGGETVPCDGVALATGNLPPPPPPGIETEGLPNGLYIADPWSGSILDDLRTDDTMLIMGTGLTMIDVVLLADARKWSGRIVALSRRGLVPRTHGEATAQSRSPTQPLAHCRSLVGAIRLTAETSGWRSAVDQYRPLTQGIWRAMPIGERQRFLRHLRPWWDVHRHRIAPQIADRILTLRGEGRLDVVAGRLDGVEAIGGAGAVAHVRRRNAIGAEALRVGRIVNAMGPQGDLTRTEEPLLRRLTERGIIRPDPLHIGIDVDQNSYAIAADGETMYRLLVIGPMTRGAFWEIVAVPDIRQQAWSIARALSGTRQA